MDYRPWRKTGRSLDAVPNHYVAFRGDFAPWRGWQNERAKKTLRTGVSRKNEGVSRIALDPCWSIIGIGGQAPRNCQDYDGTIYRSIKRWKVSAKGQGSAPPSCRLKYMSDQNHARPGPLPHLVRAEEKMISAPAISKFIPV